MEYMPELQRARIPDALARTEGGEDQSIRGKVQKLSLIHISEPTRPY